jgi:hypothetical protein
MVNNNGAAGVYLLVNPNAIRRISGGTGIEIGYVWSGDETNNIYIYIYTQTIPADVYTFIKSVPFFI